MNILRLARISLLSALALIFGYIESLFPLPIPIPGIKLGISNVVILFAILKIGSREAFLIMLVKVLASSLLWGGMSGLIYSLSGGILSTTAMIAFKKHFSTIGLSILGGMTHNLGQLTSAAIMLGTSSTFYYLPFLIISGLVVGAVIGTVCKLTITHLEKSGFC